MSNEVYLLGIVITGIASAVIGGVVGTHLTLARATSIIEALRQDKPWEQAVQALYRSVPTNVQSTVTQGADLLKEVDGLAQDVTQPTPPTPPAN